MSKRQLCTKMLACCHCFNGCYQNRAFLLVFLVIFFWKWDLHSELQILSYLPYLHIFFLKIKIKFVNFTLYLILFCKSSVLLYLILYWLKTEMLKFSRYTSALVFEWNKIRSVAWNIYEIHILKYLMNFTYCFSIWSKNTYSKGEFNGLKFNQ